MRGEKLEVRGEKLEVRGERIVMEQRNIQKWVRCQVWGVLMLLSVMLLPLSCASIDCPITNTVYCVYDLQKTDGSADTLRIDTLWARAQCINSTDTLLINRLCGSNATKLYIPISYTQTEDVIFLEVRDTSVSTKQTIWKDTIHLTKENSPHFEGVDCKANYFHQVTGISSTHHLIDTIIINNTEVNYDASKAHFLLRLKARR